MEYMNVKCADIVSAGILTNAEMEWACSVRIPYNATGKQWMEKHRIDSIVSDAIAAGTVSVIPREEVVIRRGPQVIGDYIVGAGDALRSMADGKMYDSKSEYRKSLKQHGMVELGNDAPTKCKDFEYKICDKELKHDIYESIKQLGG